jgi:hypothetical protein
MILEIGLAIKTMQAAFDGIQYCVEALNEGTVTVQKVKKGVEQAQSIIKETKNIWSMIRQIIGMLTGKKPVETAAPPVQQKTEEASVDAKPAAKKRKDEYTTHVPNEREIVQQFLGHLGAFFKAHRETGVEVDRLLELEYNKDIPDPDTILQLSAYKHELDQAYTRLSGMMRGAHVPTQLGPLWDNYNAIYGQIKEEQQRRREAERINRVNDQWQRDQLHNYRIDKAMAALGVILVLLWMWPVMWWLSSLVKTHVGFRG